MLAFIFKVHLKLLSELYNMFHIKFLKDFYFEVIDDNKTRTKVVHKNVSQGCEYVRRS